MGTRNSEKGIALITVLLVMMLMMALLVGFTAVVSSDQRYRFIDRDRNQAFYAASAGIEKMTADLGNLFLSNVAPTVAQLTTLSSAAPVISQASFTASTAAPVVATSSLTRCAAPNTVTGLGANGYTIQFCAAPNGRPTTTSNTPIKTGPYEGLIAAQMPYQLDVTARTRSGGEVHLVRTMEAVAIPVFQFGVFSSVDLAFFAGPRFDFGGRVHTNGNLFLSEGSGNQLILRDKVTAVGEIIRQKMQNGVSIDASPAHTGTVSMAQAPNLFRDLLRTEGSKVDDVASADNEPTWHNTSLSTYNSWIRNGRTGARTLNLDLIAFNGANIDMIRRPPAAEDVNNPLLLSERLFTKASLRVLLSDTANDITSLPGVTAAAPVSLDGDWNTTPPAGYAVDATHPPIARSATLLSATVAANVAVGTAQTIAVNGLAPAGSLTTNLSVTKGASTWAVTCTGKTATTLTGCTSTPAHTVNTTTPATLTATVNTPDGASSVTAALTGTWNNGSTTISVSTATIPQTTVWIGGQSITCAGPNSDTTLRNCNVPAAISANDPITNGYRTPAGTGMIGGFIKIERGNVDGTWTDVTTEILNYGIAAPNQRGAACNPTPNAIIQLQRVRDHSNTAACPIRNASSDYWPNALYDTRESLTRDTAPGGNPLYLGGVMYYVGVNADNLARWFMRTGAYAAGTGNLSKTDNGGFTLYFSDRRNNRNAASAETGEFGFEDIINPTGATGTLDVGEDVNANGALDTYGQFPNYNGVANSVVAGSQAPLDAAARLGTVVTASVAQVNRPVLFRRALKLTNGANLLATGITGLTVVSENPTYVHGNWNSPGNFNNPDVATAVMADTVTLLSNGWSDVNSFANPYAIGNRSRGTQTWYRLAIISGKGIAFPNIAGTSADFGTDGGTHNFLRYLEDGDQAVNYMGSMATFYYSRQAVGTFKCCNTVYAAPTRNYSFDTNFLNPSQLPPNTPMFRDLNAVGFAQELRPGK